MASTFTFKPVEKTKYDLVSLGEVMMRIDPGDIPTARAKTARIWHGGGETNVAEGAAYAYKLRGAVVTALVDDGIGRNIEAQLNEAGVDTSNIIWFNNAGKGTYVIKVLNAGRYRDDAEACMRYVLGYRDFIDAWNIGMYDIADVKRNVALFSEVLCG